MPSSSVANALMANDRIYHHPPPPCVTRPRCHGLCHHATQHTIDCMVFISNVAKRFRMISYHNVSGVRQVICIRVKNREGIGFPLKHTSEIWSQHILYIPVWIINFVQNWSFPNKLLHKKQKKEQSSHMLLESGIDSFKSSIGVTEQAWGMK